MYNQVIDIAEWMSAVPQATTATKMPARVKNTIILVLIVTLAYVIYTLLLTRHETSHPDNNNLQQVAVIDLSLSGAKPQKNQGQTVAINADGAPIDIRSDKCRRQRYSNVERLTATIVVDLPGTGVDGKQFQSTIDSLLSGAQSYVDEVIVVASGLQGSVAAELDKYLSSLDVAGRFIRNTRAGQATLRVAGAKLAKSPVVVFADWQVVGTVGWLRPLLGALATEPSSIVVPHLIDASNSAAFATTPERLLAEYTWPLSVRMMENASAEPTSHGLYRSPALRGDLFAVRRDYWYQLGSYEDALGEDSAAANLELSIRAWQCGSSGGAGSILMHRCSHIGVRDIREVVRVVEPNSVKHIAQLWFGNRRTIMMKSAGVSSDTDDPPSPGKRDDCRNIDTYFSDIASVPVPSAEAIRFGQLQAYTGKLYIKVCRHNFSCISCRIHKSALD